MKSLSALRQFFPIDIQESDPTYAFTQDQIEKAVEEKEENDSEEGKEEDSEAEEEDLLAGKKMDEQLQKQLRKAMKLKETAKENIKDEKKDVASQQKIAAEKALKLLQDLKNLHEERPLDNTIKFAAISIAPRGKKKDSNATLERGRTAAAKDDTIEKERRKEEEEDKKEREKDKGKGKERIKERRNDSEGEVSGQESPRQVDPKLGRREKREKEAAELDAKRQADELRRKEKQKLLREELVSTGQYKR